MTTPDSAIPIEEKLTAFARAERLARARSLAKNYVLASASIALIPVPLADLAGIMALQVKLVHGLAKHYEVPFKESIVKSLVASLLSGASSVIGVLGLASFAKIVPVLGTLAGGGGVAVTAVSVTYATGEVFIRHFESGGTLLDFDPDKVRALFKRELKASEATTEVADTSDSTSTKPA